MARRVDDLCVLRSLSHNSPIHARAEFLATTGSLTGTRRSWGVALLRPGQHEPRPAGVRRDPGRRKLRQSVVLVSGFLPAKYQGTVVNARDGIPYVALQARDSLAARRRRLNALERLNRRHLERLGGNSELEARIESYELAFRMQTAAPEAFDLVRETAETQAFYGIDRPESAESAGTASWPAAWSSAACGLCSSTRGGGTRISNLKKNHDAQGAQDRSADRRAARRPEAAGCSRRRSSSGAASSAAPPRPRAKAERGRDHSPAGYTVWLAEAG